MNVEQETAAAVTLPETINQGDISICLPSEPANIIHPLSVVAKALLHLPEDSSAMPGSSITGALTRLLKSSEVLWRSESSSNRYIVKCDAEIIVKCVDNNGDFTEYTSIQYLETHKPQIPVPRPHGLIVSGSFAYIFMSLIPGSTLSQQCGNTISMDLKRHCLETKSTAFFRTSDSSNVRKELPSAGSEVKAAKMFEGIPKDATGPCIPVDNFGNSSTRNLTVEAKSIFSLYGISLGLFSRASAFSHMGMFIR